jgi:cobalt-zinc-cadmium resistance protein CzcA
MLTSIIDFSLKNRMLILVLTVLMAMAGLQSALLLPIDAVPDMTNVQVQIVTDAGSLPPVEVERYVTYPVEGTMRGLPGVEEVRSVSKFGISVVTVVFEESTDLHFARQVVNQRLIDARAAVPESIGVPQLGPMSTALGEILQFEVRGEGYDAMELRTMLEWQISPRLREVEGVTEVNSHGGYYKTFEVQPSPERMAQLNVGLDELFDSLEANNQSVGGGYIIRHNEQQFVRGVALLEGVKDLENVVIKVNDDEGPVLVRDIAKVRIEPLTRQGAVTRDGRGEIVTGMVMMIVGENSRTVVERVKDRIEEIGTTLPSGVTLEIIYDRAALIQRTLKTVLKNLFEGGLLVVVVLFIMLGSFRAGVITALAIPLSMMFATNLMLATGITASLMSLGAIDFGLIVDSSVIMVENCMRRISHAPDGRSRLQIIRDAAVEVRKPTMFGELIIAIVYVPILTLQGTEGKLFRPMALTVLFALAGSLILSMTFVPALASLALNRNSEEKEVWLVRQLKRIYRPVVEQSIRHPWSTVYGVILIFLLSLPVAYNLGAEFMPRLEEGDLLVEALRLPTSTLEDSVKMSTQIEKELLRFDEVETVFCKTGRPEIANDVMGVHQTDVWAILKPKHEWSEGKTREDLIEEMSEVLPDRVPGVAFGFTQPIEMRVDELVAGVKADVAVIIYGEDLERINQTAQDVESVLRTIEGAVDIKSEYQSNLSTLRIQPRSADLAQYGVSSEEVMRVVASIGGRQSGAIYEGRARFPVLVRVPQEWRANPKLLKQVPVKVTGDRIILLGDVADLVAEETPPSVEHEQGHRRTYVQANVRGRDVASFVAEARKKVDAQVTLPPGYELRWGGDFEHLQTASRRLLLITPVVLVMILLLLQLSFRSMPLALMIFMAVPVAASGGVFALALRGMPFSISAGVGFIALFGVAVLNGLVWVSAAEQLRREGFSSRDAAYEAALGRLRPILMTALVASLGFLPMAMSTSDGAEIQRPLATVVIGGLVTATVLTSVVLPAIYPWVAKLAPVVDDQE